MPVNYELDNGISGLHPNAMKIPENIPIVDGHQHYKFPPTFNHYGTTGSYLYKKDREKRSIGLSVLTLLSFLFFLHILQSCLQEQVDNSNAQTPVVIMQAKLESGDQPKTAAWEKLEKNVQKGASDIKKASSFEKGSTVVV
uniref:Uncharacterized protein n=1 Tax=Dendroctonus ponderosae TaxID=77166 RepID=A0AAR5Q2I3_DENPD